MISRLFTKPLLNLYTVCRRVEGDVAALREELSEYLFEKYEQEFISQVLILASHWSILLILSSHWSGQRADAESCVPGKL